MSALDEDTRAFIAEAMTAESRKVSGGFASPGPSAPAIDVAPLSALVADKDLRRALNDFRSAMGLETAVEMTSAFQEMAKVHADLARKKRGEQKGKTEDAGGAGSGGESSSTYSSSSDGSFTSVFLNSKLSDCDQDGS
jgi:hypothetical protein